MEDVATELLSLIALADLPSQSIPIETRHVFAARSGQGTIVIDVADHECLVITRIALDNVDWALAASLSISQRGQLLSPLNTALEALDGEPLLMVFEQGQLLLTFALTAVAGRTARIKIQGARLPREAGKRLRQIGSKIA